MKHMKKILALVLVVMSVLAIAVPAMADTVNVGWVSATAIGDFWGMVSCIYSQKNDSSAYVVQAFQTATSIQVKFDQSSLYWASAKYGTVTGYMPFHHFEITDSNLRVGLFSSYSLQRGHTGTAVRNLQLFLQDAGHDPNGIDGIFGSGTEDAVERFQDDKGLTVDGIAGYNTKMALIDECYNP